MVNPCHALLMFNRVVIINKTQQAENIHLAVHPFPFDHWITSMHKKGDYGHSFGEEGPEVTSEWQQRLADALWDGIPGLDTIFFKNGEITLQHAGVFSDEEIIEGAIAIIKPVLEQNLILSSEAFS
jgi:hypothetical protein